jgi:transcriptional regulator with XRE-family HTH domain
MYEQYAGHMQEFFSREFYDSRMAAKKNESNLRALREAAGISQRELARLIGERQSNIQYWETTGKIPRSDVLAALAKSLGVSVEELLGHPRPKRGPIVPGKLARIFERASRLPRRQQEKIIEFVEPFIRERSKEEVAAH